MKYFNEEYVMSLRHRIEVIEARLKFVRNRSWGLIPTAGWSVAVKFHEMDNTLSVQSQEMVTRARTLLRELLSKDVPDDAKEEELEYILETLEKRHFPYKHLNNLSEVDWQHDPNIPLTN